TGVIGPTPAPATPTSTPARAAIAIPAAAPTATPAAPPTAPASTPTTAAPTASSIGLRGGILIELAALRQGGLRIHLLSERSQSRGDGLFLNFRRLARGPTKSPSSSPAHTGAAPNMATAKPTIS